MTKEETSILGLIGKPMNRRKALQLAATVLTAAVITAFGSHSATASSPLKGKSVSHKAYVYTELQISTPFKDVPWQKINKTIKKQPGFLNKTWLAGLGNNSVGGFYAFDTIENAEKFVTDYFPGEAKSLGVAQTTRVFDAGVTETASRDMNSVYYDGKIDAEPGAFVYTEVWLQALPFDEAAPWRVLNPALKKQPGLMAKTWLSGLHTGTPGGLYAFDTIENARKFVLDYFPAEAKALNAAFYTRVFDADATEAASRDMSSPFYH